MPKAERKRPFSAPQIVRTTLRAGKVSMKAEVRATPLGILAVGGLVASILLSVVPIVRASKNRFKALPLIDAGRLDDRQPTLNLLPNATPSPDNH